MISALCCSDRQCGHISPTNSPFSSLTLHVPTGDSKITLDELVKDFFTKETLVGSDIARCPNCGQTSASEKRLSLLSEPTALFLHLKRFRQNGAPRLNQLSFFLKGLRLGSEHDQASGVYDCVAISQYFPRGGGHYTANAKRNEAWFNFDDSSTELLSPIKASTISLNSSTAYLLFFVRRS